MSFSAIATLLIVSYIAASVAYVYRWRGRVRYRSFSQYLRKSWPVFAPFNCLLYMATRRSTRRAVLDADYLPGIDRLRAHWPEIRGEAIALLDAGELDATALPGSAGYHDLGFRTFYKRGWRKFYLKWYGEPHASARRLCPRTVELLEAVPGIRAAMFSVLPPEAELSLHADPLACSLRYHLGLDAPGCERCFIEVDGRRLIWRDGKDFVFDETYPHYAVNASRRRRLILMCDVDRPMNLFGRAFNGLYCAIPAAMRVANTAEDERGAVSRLFAVIAPWRERALAFKKRRRAAYVLLRMLLNWTAVGLALWSVYAMLGWAERAGASALA
ncbi:MULTISPECIES: aspartyl/asparaginyl beta-hydroxylase domain-containing protein [unclassified Lysobacter]|uniref:aspartyl/asparaginyl beta-hydroxylase domain-containing protein n=1 Tax=unclassified Lysobacter TaxID=2635362 RepID=UPI001BED1AE5|nr:MULTISPECIES: aspartyl/asparaginyl beta-hydroxylase domain-containing protein [unclassified Lysobacter]MBT2748744.1 aspartyl/asparaginyl beta-hydroxylase domain-containing protein [Lysobacter sp. ISL-42]MBT2751679.1 aspartyl/asparaginyl beta-hydroxylase domain-containing protein [Lysobacter sp. ISL-50]MBT2775873.1 aspartyl/asparaginyl beta-hydroxylase domain-containing protein [Lysobacter sp. ISL-54]MBT2782163.1 aspartyl/asparaginyl beta-hydroxylase domain-containing protein [Lysobacter sp. 